MNTTRSLIVLLFSWILFAQKPVNLSESQQREILFDLAELKSMESEIQSWHSKVLQDLNEELRKRQTVIAQKKAALEKRVKDLGIPDDQELSFDPTTRKVIVTRKTAESRAVETPSTPPSKPVQPVTGKVPPDDVKPPQKPPPPAKPAKPEN
jgi:hypothetical protein